jgi:hypothetical protein
MQEIHEYLVSILCKEASLLLIQIEDKYSQQHNVISVKVLIK